MGVAVSLAALALPFAIAARPPAAIDWVEGVVDAWGRGLPGLFTRNIDAARASAERAARDEAIARALAEVDRAPFGGALTAGQALAQGPAGARDRIRDRWRSVRATETTYFSNAAVVARYRFALADVLGELVARIAEPAPEPTAAEPIVVDGRHLTVSPALVPRVLDAAGRERYGPPNALSARSPRIEPVRYVARPAGDSPPAGAERLERLLAQEPTALVLSAVAATRIAERLARGGSVIVWVRP